MHLNDANHLRTLEATEQEEYKIKDTEDKVTYEGPSFILTHVININLLSIIFTTFYR